MLFALYAMKPTRSEPDMIDTLVRAHEGGFPLIFCENEDIIFINEEFEEVD